MDGIICANCHSWLAPGSPACPGCGNAVIAAGSGKNIIDRFEPDCLIHRYEGSDLLEPAVVIKQGKSNIKAATKLKEYAQPVTVPRQKVYAFDAATLGAIQSLRNERTAAIRRYDRQILAHWQKLRPYSPEN